MTRGRWLVALCAVIGLSVSFSARADFSDNFNDNSLSTSKWPDVITDEGGNVAEVSRHLEFKTSNTPDYAYPSASVTSQEVSSATDYFSVLVDLYDFSLLTASGRTQSSISLRTGLKHFTVTLIKSLAGGRKLEVWQEEWPGFGCWNTVSVATDKVRIKISFNAQSKKFSSWYDTNPSNADSWIRLPDLSFCDPFKSTSSSNKFSIALGWNAHRDLSDYAPVIANQMYADNMFVENKNFPNNYKQTIYLNFNGGLVAHQGDYFSMPGSGYSQSQIDAITSNIGVIFNRFNISVTSSKPISGPYSQVYIVGANYNDLKNNSDLKSTQPLWWQQWTPETVGKADQVDFKNINHGDTALVLEGQLSTQNDLQYVVAHEAGHLMGLVHVDNNTQLLYPYNTCGGYIISDIFFQVANAKRDGETCTDIVPYSQAVNNYRALGKYIGLADGTTISYADGWVDKLIRDFSTNFWWSTSTNIYAAKAALLYADDAGPMIFDLGDLVAGNTNEAALGVSGWSKMYIYGSSEPGGAVDIIGVAIDTTPAEAGAQSAWDNAVFIRGKTNLLVYQNVDGEFVPVGDADVEIQYDIHYDIDIDGQIDGQDYSLLVAALGACTGDTRYYARADLDGDNCVTNTDIEMWKDYYLLTNGQEFTMPQPTAIPIASTWTLIVLMGMLALVGGFSVRARAYRMR